MANDRGTIKWTSLMLPEHVELLKKMWAEDRKADKPILDNQQIELLNMQLQEAFDTHSVIELSFYLNEEIINRTGIISGMDRYRQCITLKQPDYQEITVSFKDILSVSPR